MKITTETINYIAKLAKLRFNEDEAETFAKEFEGILDHFQNLDKEDLSMEGLAAAKEGKSILRKDEIKPFENKEELFQNAKGMRESYLSIPKVIE
ncbi:MAG: glutamyl-tRNA amidotransferase [Anaerosolibacter sp.]|jgi:aspartyl-tRNA(Asn)/glutamyl-tRNA(Gln) amidotransferase subunit C|uniref:Asp-tRNA(Asn)/Glu-tRNA(Gln) amidotransferase subunit GatC n=1 Tax=Anaerosolibacter sp. TaxID=1872527 RepID=UPI00262CAA2E|nr:Asp-tRNA(Asn)/Glu-tRNA(Gln) amidotransferase subunit GatC [Anaerosolibacter sp.]MDF2547421.1 glutamyl-tRNA amidotransferase [Anaerosolibacter sp.]